jgi:hypothetical protein
MTGNEGGAAGFKIGETCQESLTDPYLWAIRSMVARCKFYMDWDFEMRESPTAQALHYLDNLPLCPDSNLTYAHAPNPLRNEPRCNNTRDLLHFRISGQYTRPRRSCPLLSDFQSTGSLSFFL